MASKARRITIVGASAAGLRCAARLARLEPDLNITVVESEESFSYAACGFPYVLSGDVEGLEKLRHTGDGALRDASYFAAVKGFEVLAGFRAVEIRPAAHRLVIQGVAGTRELEWDELVLATGARPRRCAGQPEHPRIRMFHRADDLRVLQDKLSGKELGKVVIIGAGFLGCELAESLTAIWDTQVTLVEAAQAPLSKVLDPEVGKLVAAVLRQNEIELLTSRPVEKIEANEGGVRVTAGGRVLEADLAIVAVGLEPAVDLAVDAGVVLGPTGAIAVSDQLATSVPHIWAVGDCVEVAHALTGGPAHLPLGSLANRQGRTLANVLTGRADSFPQVAGAFAVKVFDCQVATVGITRQQARKHFDSVRSVWLSSRDRPHYWPEAKDIYSHLVYDASSQRVLGVQMVGAGDVTKRIDLAAQWLAQGVTLGRLGQLEHAYSPPFAPAIDPLAEAAFVALNQEEGVEALSPEAPFPDLDILDVRHPQESQARPLEAKRVTCIPQEALRQRFHEVKGRGWLVVCERGPRSAEVARLLQANGMPACYLGGGLRWRNRITPML